MLTTLTEKQLDMLDKAFTKALLAKKDKLSVAYSAENNEFSAEIYSDYRDEFDNDTINEILLSNNPNDKLYEVLTDIYADHEFAIVNDIAEELQKECEKYLSADTFSMVHEDDLVDMARDWVCENVEINLPIEHYLNQNVCLDVIIDAGDENYDYTHNTAFKADTFGHSHFYSDAGLVWLANQQGYSKSTLEDAVFNGNFGTDHFLESVRDEVYNSSTSMNAVSFFVSETLEACIKLNEKLKDTTVDREQCGIRLDKNIKCGLYDCWNGSGSDLEISLTSSCEIPLRKISTALQDGCRYGYGAKQIYGLSSNFWHSGNLEVIEISKAKNRSKTTLRDITADAQERSKATISQSAMELRTKIK